jgi:hypothetical protein
MSCHDTSPGRGVNSSAAMIVFLVRSRWFFSTEKFMRLLLPARMLLAWFAKTHPNAASILINEVDTGRLKCTSDNIQRGAARLVDPQANWWANMQVAPLPIAKELWEASPIHATRSPAATSAILGPEGIAI